MPDVPIPDEFPRGYDTNPKLSEGDLENIVKKVLEKNMSELLKENGMQDFIDQELTKAKETRAKATAEDPQTTSLLKNLTRIKATIELKNSDIFTSKTSYQTAQKVFQFHDSITDVTAVDAPTDTSANGLLDNDLTLYSKIADAATDFYSDVSEAATEALETHKKMMKKILKNHSNLSDAEINDLVDNNSDRTGKAKGKVTLDDLNAEQKAQIKGATKSVLDRFGDFVKDVGKGLYDLVLKIIELAKLLAPIFGIWVLYNLLKHVLSGCYWHPTNPKCKYTGENGEAWTTLQTVKKTMKKEDTQASTMNMATFGATGKKPQAQCACNDSTILKVVKNEKDEYGTINTDGISTKNDCLDDTTRQKADDGTIGCFNRVEEPKPICLKWTGDDNRSAATICGGRYEFYEADLGDILDAGLNLVEKAITDPFGFIKIIIYVIVAIIMVFVVISMLRYAMSK